MKNPFIMGLAVTLACSPLSHALVVIYVDQDAAGLDDGTSWGNAYTDLQDALTDAAVEALSDDVEIWVAEGTYKPGASRSDTFQLIDGVTLYGGFKGTEPMVSLRDENPETNNTILSGDIDGDDTAGFTNYDDNCNNVVTATGTDSTAVLDGFTIRSGYADGYDDGVNPPLPNRGAGLIFTGSGSASILNCLFIENEATGTPQSTGNGGAVTIDGSLGSGGAQPLFEDCKFINNKALSYGGAVEVATTAQPIFRGCLFEANISNYQGGAMRVQGCAITLESCSFRGNQVDANPAIFPVAGALYLRGTDLAGYPKIINCEFIGNEAPYIGGCYLLQATPVFTNCSFSGNNGTTNYGAVLNSNSTVEYNNCVIWNNKDGGNTDTLAESILNNASTVSVSNSIVEHSGGSGGGWNPGAGTDGGANIDSDPLFYTPADTSTTPNSIGDLRLLTGSPGANAGSNSADLDGAGSGTDTITSITTDLAGDTRIQDVTVEIGAYEGEFVNPLDTFGELFPGLTTSGDENGNGIDNFLEYALGYDPEGANDPSILPTIDGNLWMVSYRTGVIDAAPVYRMSSDLSSWTDMQVGVDYTVQSVTPDTDREDAVLLLDPSVMANPKMFFTEFFSEP